MQALENQFPATSFALLAVVVLLPAIGAFVNGVFGKRLGREGVRLMALSAIFGSFLASVATFLMLPHAEEGAAPARLVWKAWDWFDIVGRGGRTIPIEIAFSVDAMSATMMLVVTGVGFLIHLYSTEYMKHDPGYARFFAYLNLFCFAMLVLITADNLPLLFVGWEGVGLCSYLLIGFWYQDDKNASAGKKAFIANRIGDFGLLLAMAMLIYFAGALSWSGIESSAQNLLTSVKVWPLGNLPTEIEWDRAAQMTGSIWPSWLVHVFLPERAITVSASTLVGLAIFLGCAGKSAQIPLYVWLPDAMAGPTPVSALIHAATMVTAGVYLVARTSAVFVLSPAVMATVAVTGAATALFAATIGMVQTDLKKVLAYSTVSQLGFMFIGVGVGAFGAGFFHVFTHAFFKACLFLGAGSVIHAMHARIHDSEKSQDMRNMGGLRHHMPITRWTFFIACLAIAGAPFMSGFWSKDEVLWKAFSVKITAPATRGSLELWTWPDWLGQAIYWVGIIAATMTAFYMFRAYFMTFHGRFRGWKVVRGFVAPKHGHDDHGSDHHKEEGPLQGPAPKESPLAMTLPLMILAAFAAFGGFLYAEPIHVEPLGHMLHPIWEKTSSVVGMREGAEALMWPMMLPGVAAFLAGTGFAMYVYLNRRGAPETAFAKRYPSLYLLVYDKWRIDELYEATVIGTVDALADIFTMADKWIVDGILAKVTAALVGFLGTMLRALQTGRVQAYAASMMIGLAGIGWFVTTPHASATIDDREIKRSGMVVISAAPGLGYGFRWEDKGKKVETPPDSAPPAFSPSDDRFAVTLQPGETREVILHVRSAFGRESTMSFPLSRPNRQGRPPGVIPVEIPPNGVVPGDLIPDLIQPGGAR